MGHRGKGRKEGGQREGSTGEGMGWNGKGGEGVPECPNSKLASLDLSHLIQSQTLCGVISEMSAALHDVSVQVVLICICTFFLHQTTVFFSISLYHV